MPVICQTIITGRGKRPALPSPPTQGLLTAGLNSSPQLASQRRSSSLSSSSPGSISLPSPQLQIASPQPLLSPGILSSVTRSDNPFLPSSVTQRIIGNAEARIQLGQGQANQEQSWNPNTFESVGRSALMKMNEMSRRVEAISNNDSNGSGSGSSSGDYFSGRLTPGFGFGGPSGAGSRSGTSLGGGERPPSRLWTAATNAGLINPDGSFVNPLPGSSSSNTNSNGGGSMSGQGRGMDGFSAPMGPVKITSTQEALAKIEELQRMRPASAGFLSNAAARLVNAFETFGSMGMGNSSERARDAGAVKTEDMGDQPSSVPPPRPRSQLGINVSELLADPWNMTMALPTVPSLPPTYDPDTEVGPSSSVDKESASTNSGAQASSSSSSSSSLFPDFTTNHQGLQVYTVGHLMPRSAIDDMSGTWSLNTNMIGESFASGSGTGDGLNVGSQETRADGSGPSGLYDGSPNAASSPSSSGPGLASGSGAGPSSSGPGSPMVVQSSAPGTSSESGSQKLRVRRSTFVPGWAVSPRVLLVEDDAVSRKLSSKFLQVFGCKIDVAVDGVGAVNKMNLEKYDLVLMDIVMPKLDGVSATSMIRKFDHMTPIISMTSNSKPDEIMTYYSSGMNDILPKPFTKQGLLDMLEKHLMHLKVIQQMARIPRSVGIPPLSDAGFEQALTSHAALITNGNNNNDDGSSSSALTPFGQSLALRPNDDLDDNNGRINPLAGMGLTDEQYNMILAGIVNGDTFAGSMSMGMGFGGDQSFDGSGSSGKRGLDDGGEEGRDPKRSRFEVIE
ncbi:hypothetical protein D9758_008187 [Tetrapyrgos nigripes]|uniref:Response regulatory domain-containing protein n=1 Tax=Tetrapyrgos nigripes TaxID=182062 RepID=A0A8H5GH23_9AGAR|nr:hypothetical protein D9758_008187 [Tetrapyrgos nigripes]